MTEPAALYDEHAAGEVERFATLMNGVREHLDRFYHCVKWVRELRPRSLLDVACGYGHLTALYAFYLDGPERVLGLDVSPLHCAVAGKGFGVDTVRLAVEEATPERVGGTFELVCCTELLEHVEAPWVVVRRCADLSTRWLFFSTPVEAQDVDGTFHVRHVSPANHYSLIATNAPGFVCKRLELVPSLFCEKPKWLGWTFSLWERT